MPENNGDGWANWANHVLAELKRNADGNQRIEDKLDTMNEQLTRHEVYIEEAKDKDIIGKVVNNTKFVTNVNKLVWKLVGTALVSAGGITGLVNYLSGAFTK